MQNPQGIIPLLLQILVLGAGIAIIATHARWSDAHLALVAGIFFCNIFWVTMVLGHDFAIWSWLRNTAAGNIFMFVLIAANLVYIGARVLMKLF